MATTEMVKRALDEATPAQLIRVRSLISKNADSNAMMDLNPLGYKCEIALKAFDKGAYDDPCIANVLKDGELGEALR